MTGNELGVDTETGDGLKSVVTDEAPKPIGPYSQAIVVGGFVFCSGQLGLDPETGELEGPDARAQADRAIENLGAVLKAAGSRLDLAFKVTLYLKDMKDFPVVNEVYAKHFGNAKPARSTIEVSALPKGALVEIDAVALVRSARH
jgi:2-iminobutanoate/2-iminopropanoate deaminase